MDTVPNGDNALTSSGATWQHHMAPRTFAGKVGEDVEEWLNHYSRVSRYNRWNSDTRLTNVPLFLEGTALVWFENHEETLATWEDFVDEVKSGFGDPSLKKKRSEQTLMQRAQVPGETCTIYIEEILKLCKSVDPRMKEEDKVGHLLKGIAEDVYNFLIGKDTLESVADVIKHCRTFETLKAKRITPKFGRLANVTTVASVDVGPIPPCDLASTIRQIVREELDRREAVAATRPRVSDAYLPYDATCASVHATGHDDAPRSRAPERPTYDLHRRDGPQHAFNQPRTMASSWDDHHEYTEPSGRFRDLREAPVCFQCGVRGHVARFCPERRRGQPRFYENPPASPRRNNRPGSARWTRDTYFGNSFQQNSRGDTFMGNNYRQNTRSDSPASVRSLTPPTARRRRSPSPGRRVTSPPPGN